MKCNSWLMSGLAIKWSSCLGMSVMIIRQHNVIKTLNVYENYSKQDIQITITKLNSVQNIIIVAGPISRRYHWYSIYEEFWLRWTANNDRIRAGLKNCDVGVRWVVMHSEWTWVSWSLFQLSQLHHHTPSHKHRASCFDVVLKQHCFELYLCTLL